MPAAKVRADYQELNRIAAEFARQAEQTQQTHNRLRQMMQALRNGDWVGLGANQFYAEMDAEVLPTFQRLINALSEAGQVTRQVAGLMGHAEAEAAALFRAGSGGLSGFQPSVPAFLGDAAGFVGQVQGLVGQSLQAGAADHAGRVLRESLGVLEQAASSSGSAAAQGLIQQVNALKDRVAEVFAGHAPAAPNGGTLKTGDDGVITTPGGYKIVADGDFAWTVTGPDGQSTRVWGDPHIDHTDSQAGGSSSLVLPDGTRINVTNPPDASGISVTSGLEITNGSDSVTVSGSPEPPPPPPAEVVDEIVETFTDTAQAVAGLFK